jgi:NAD(P)H dehydrogenase (quinone)
MNILVVTAAPRGDSLITSLADRYLAGMRAEGVQHVERADLLGEAFDPRLMQHDLAFYQGKGPIPDDVRREQERIERADVLVLAFPIYWWSLPAVMKGWIDRVFTNGWAFGAGERFAGPLAAKKVRLIATGGAAPRAYEKHGYRAAIAAQIEHGIFNFSGVRDVQTHLFLEAENGDQAARLRNLSSAYELGRSVIAGSSLAAAPSAA